MIIKKQNLPSKALADLITFINGKDCVPDDALVPVITLKSVNPGNERGLYSVDLEFEETYVNSKDERRATGSVFWVRLYDIIGGRA